MVLALLKYREVSSFSCHNKGGPELPIIAEKNETARVIVNCAEDGPGHHMTIIDYFTIHVRKVYSKVLSSIDKIIIIV